MCQEQRHAGEVCSVPGPHTANCKGCPTKTGGPEGLGPTSGKGLHTDGGRHPAVVHQHGEAVVRRRRQEGYDQNRQSNQDGKDQNAEEGQNTFSPIHPLTFS
ncbi:hypothetical protein Trydic_g16166 [Trypoxylus dichotomus]